MAKGAIMAHMRLRAHPSRHIRSDEVTMSNPQSFRRTASHSLHGHWADQHLPERLHAPILAAMKSLVYPSDLEDAVQMVGDDFDPVNFELSSMTFADLEHPIIAYVLDPEADDLRHVVVEQEDGPRMHAVLASGSNSMGFVFDDEGAVLYKIYDGSVDAADGGPSTSAAQVALHALLFMGSDGQSVSELKDAIASYDESRLQLLFGE